MRASGQVVEAAGGAWSASLNYYDAGGGGFVVTQQVDEHVYVIGEQDFGVAHYDLTGWLNKVGQPNSSTIECSDAGDAWNVLRHLRAGSLLWQCDACDAWIFTSNRPRVGSLQCSTCGDGAVDFRQDDRWARRGE